MNNINLSSNLFIGKHELQHIWDFLNDKTFLLNDAYSFGIIRSKADSSFLNFKIESGTNSGTIKIANDSYALDSNGNIIYKKAEDNIIIPDDGNFYWVKIKHLVSNIEEGLVSIDASGNLTGVGTSFLSVLRGQPNHPSKIKLTDASLNTQEYTVQEVISDTSAVLLGVFQSELNLHYGVVGTFTPGIVPTSDEKYPFDYDSCIPFTVAGGGLVLETVSNTAPAKTDGEEFYIARIKRNGATLTIEDKRTEYYQNKSQFDVTYVDRTQVNALIGVEQIRYDNIYSTLNHNEIKIGWGMRSTNWVVNSELRRITIVGANESGKFKAVSDFTDGDFDNWRIYAKNGTYKKITSSVLSGGQINLILDSLDPDDYTTNDELVIVPDVDNIQIRFRQDAATTAVENIEKIFEFPIRQGYALMKILVPVNTGTYSYNITYRYKHYANYTDWLVLPTDTVNGYYNESSFEANGTLKVNPLDRTRQTYTGHASNGYIIFTAAPGNYFVKISGLTRGDAYGVTTVNLNDVDKHPLYELEVGANDQVQIFQGTNNLAVDWFINLKDGLQEQNEFLLVFQNAITLNTFHLRIVENYVNTSTYDELLDFTSFYIARATQGNLILRCVWNGTGWEVFKHISFLENLFGTSNGQIPNIATSFTGDQAIETDSNGNLFEISVFSTERIPNLPASRVTSGTFDAARIPSLDASKINAGTFDAARIPQATTGAVGGSALASQAEVLAGTDVNKIVTSETLAGKDGGLITSVINIGDWDMNSTGLITVAHSLGADFIKVRSVDVLIIDDASVGIYKLNNTYDGGASLTTANGDVINITSTVITLLRRTSGIFDNTDFDSTSFNRGWIVIKRLP